MKGASKVIMGATLVMIVSLAIVLALVLVLLAELYCSLLLRRRRRLGITSSNATTTAAGTTTSPTFNASSPQPQNRRDAPHTTYYAPGVLHAPRSLFFPAVSCKRNKATEIKDQLSQFHYILDVHTQESNSSSQQLGLINTSPSSTKLVTSPHQIREIPIRISSSDVNEKACGGSGELFVYISNPIYDNEASRESKIETPFETPVSSPSRLETGGSSSDEEIAQPSTSSPHSPPATPPLTPMKKLPAEACSVSLRDARSFGTSGSDIVSNNGLSSSSSLVSPCTSPSW